MMNCPNLTNITETSDIKTAMKSLRANYSQLRHAHRFPPRKGTLPSSYVKPKAKDIVEKNRVITSYFNFPMRKLLKMASKALTYLLRKLHKKHKHFTLHRILDTKHLISKQKRRWHKEFGTQAHIEVMATDLKQMFTFLDHTEIRKAVMWLFDNIQSGSAKTSNKHKRLLRKRPILIKVDLTAPYKASFTSNSITDENSVVFTLADLYSIIEFDLDNTYTTIGNQLFKQLKGCPMGGMLSSFYGNVTCAFHEHTYLTHEPLAKHIWGIRQMDDLTLFIAHDLNDPNIEAHNTRIKFDIQHNVYKGGLEAEIQPPDADTAVKYIHKFAGHEIHTHKDLSDIYTTTLNENKDSVRLYKRQAKVRYPNMFTYTNKHCKTGNIVGSIHRIRAQNTYRRDFTTAIDDLIAELKCINYTDSFIKKCLFRLAKQACWHEMLADNLIPLLRSSRTHQSSPQHNTRTTPKKYRRPSYNH